MHRTHLSPLIVVIYWSLMVGDLDAAEAVGVEIEHQERQVAGYTTTYTGQSDVELLEKLATEPLSMEADYCAACELAELDSLILEGEVLLLVHRRGDYTGTHTALDRLNMVRSAGRNNRWRVPANEVERILRSSSVVATQGEPLIVSNDIFVHDMYFRVESLAWATLATIGLVLAATSVGIVAWIVLRSRRSGS